MLMVEESHLPLSISMPGITDEHLQELCEKYSGSFLEYTAEGDLLVTPPTDPETSARNSEINFQLKLWGSEDRPWNGDGPERWLRASGWLSPLPG